jgi:hypothetical protein
VGMRHRCENNGCFLDRHVLKFEVFDDLFPNKMNFMDLDATIEYKSHFLDMEWKEDNSAITTGQTIYFQRKTTGSQHAAIMVIGNAQDMTVAGYQVYSEGTVFPWVHGDMSDLKAVISRWKKHVDKLTGER